MSEPLAQVWNTCGYVRLSREDGDKEESNSVTGQKDLIRDYLSRRPELRDCGMMVDDGFSGSNFQRPGFQKLMDEVKAGRVNCIVVKDLSRFGRNHLAAGEYIEKIFPFLGVRFIAINDHYDSLHGNPESDELVIPFKNLVNEAYIRDSSIKIRSQLEIKRQRGDFIGSFAVYGYRKSPDDRHKLVVDDFAAAVVRDIFQWKLEGYSLSDIAERLNRTGVLIPMDYKRSQGYDYSTPFRVKEGSKWCAKMVQRILQNPVYTGRLEQGRVTTPSYKVKRTVHKPREEWAIVENCHEAIIDPYDFDIIQRVLTMDTRVNKSGQTVDLFGGILYCGECGGPMVRKTTAYGSKTYIYYVCANHKKAKTCFPHRFRDTALKQIILDTLRDYIQNVIDLERLLKLTSVAQLQKANIRKLQDRLDEKQKEIDRVQTLLRSLYESLTDGILDQNEYLDLKQTYTKRREVAEEQAEYIREEMSRELSSSSEGRNWMEKFRKARNITELDRSVVVSLIERILIYQDHRVEVQFRWHDEYQWYLDLLAKAQLLSSGKEAV